MLALSSKGCDRLSPGRGEWQPCLQLGPRVELRLTAGWAVVVLGGEEVGHGIPVSLFLDCLLVCVEQLRPRFCPPLHPCPRRRPAPRRTGESSSCFPSWPLTVDTELLLDFFIFTV